MTCRMPRIRPFADLDSRRLSLRSRHVFRPTAGPDTGRAGSGCWPGGHGVGSELRKVQMVRRRSTVRFRKGARHTGRSGLCYCSAEVTSKIIWSSFDRRSQHRLTGPSRTGRCMMAGPRAQPCSILNMRSARLGNEQSPLRWPRTGQLRLASAARSAGFEKLVTSRFGRIPTGSPKRNCGGRATEPLSVDV
jgi:hypothetical protein